MDKRNWFKKVRVAFLDLVKGPLNNSGLRSTPWFLSLVLYLLPAVYRRGPEGCIFSIWHCAGSSTPQETRYGWAQWGDGIGLVGKWVSVCMSEEFQDASATYPSKILEAFPFGPAPALSTYCMLSSSWKRCIAGSATGVKCQALPWQSNIGAALPGNCLDTGSYVTGAAS